jgi:hypothetical protein
MASLSYTPITVLKHQAYLDAWENYFICTTIRFSENRLILYEIHVVIILIRYEQN